jgi:hypothetical protein
VVKTAARVLGCLLFVGVLAAAPVSASPVKALKLIDAPVEYRADYALTAAGRTYGGAMEHAPGRERREFVAGGQRQVLLVCRDTDEATILWPDKRFYVATSFRWLAGLVGGLDDIVLERRVVGQEVMAGERTTVYAFDGDSDKDVFVGRAWVTADGILMRAAGTVHFQGRVTAIDLSLSNLRRGKVESSTFVRPKDFFGLPLNPSTLGVK